MFVIRSIEIVGVRGRRTAINLFTLITALAHRRNLVSIVVPLRSLILVGPLAIFGVNSLTAVW